MTQRMPIVAGVDAGAECVKAVVLDGAGHLAGRAVVPARGYFQDCAHLALHTACDEAHVQMRDLAQICGTGFAADLVPMVMMTVNESTCHAAAAHRVVGEPMTVIDIGGRDPKVIEVGAGGERGAVRTARRCALGVGAFLAMAANQLDVHPTRLEELAANGEKPSTITSYCSVFAHTEILEQLRRGRTRDDIALGCLYSIAQRIGEIGGFREPVRISGGVVEFFPGVVRALNELAGIDAHVLPDPIFIGAIGAAAKAREAAIHRPEQVEP